MEFANERTREELAVQRQWPSKLWLWILPVLGVCTLSLSGVAGGLMFWQTRSRATTPDRPAGIETTGPGSTSSLLHSQPEPSPTTTLTPVSLPAASAQTGRLAPVLCSSSGRSSDSLAATGPILSPISFASRQDAGGWPLDSGLQFTTAVTRVQASFGYYGMRNGMSWERVWYFGDREMLRSDGIWDAGSKGELTIHVEAGKNGFVPGRYRLEIYVEGELLAASSFLVAPEETPTRRPVQVAYTVWDGSKHQINLLDLDSGETQPLLEFARAPAWSPDGVGLIFYGENGFEGGPPGLWVLNVPQHKTYQLGRETFFRSLAWSPNRVYIASSVAGRQGPRLVLWDLARSKAYTGPPGEEPAWSPEGQRLAYRSCSGNNWGISTVQVISSAIDTGSIRHLTEGDDSQPAWSWDGRRIAFVRQENGNQDIYSIAPDGSSLTRLTDHPAADTSPAWTPDNRLLFRSLRSGQWSLYIMEADGSGRRRLISTGSRPNWQPDRLAVSTGVRLVEPTPTPAPKPRVHVPPGFGVLVISNRQNNDQMTFTIDNYEHKIMPYQVKTLPLKPGHYTWTASWPAKQSRTGIADIVEGQLAYPVVEH